MGDIYLIRHAEAEGNRYRRIHGHTDTNVTKNGLRQIAALQKRFEGVKIHAVYASDLTRTCRTAMALAGPRGLEIRRDPRFREIYLGAWEDTPFGELEQTDAEQLWNFNSAPKLWRADGAERYEEYTARFLAGLRELAGRHRAEDIAIFTHGGVLFQSLRILFLGSDPGHSDNTAVTKLSYDGAFHLGFLSDNSHLDETISTLARQNWWKGQGDRADRNLWFSPYEGEIDWYLRFSDDQIPVAPMAAMFFAMLQEKPVGFVQLDPQRDQKEGAGWVDFFGLAPKLRGKGLGTQLIGCAVSFFRNAGRRCLRLELPERYRAAEKFLIEEGFLCRGGFWEKDIRVPCEEPDM